MIIDDLRDKSFCTVGEIESISQRAIENDKLIWSLNVEFFVNLRVLVERTLEIKEKLPQNFPNSVLISELLFFYV